MTTQAKTKSTKRLKIIPGRGLTGRDIQKRLRNRTLEGQTFGEDAYAMNEDMNDFMKMNKVERLNAARANNAKMREIQNKLDTETNEKKQKQQQQNIENEIQKRLAEMRKEEPKNEK